MSKVYIVANGDFYDYDAPAPGGVFSTREKALEFINSSISFIEQNNYGLHQRYRCYYSAEYTHIYEFNLDQETQKAPYELVVHYADIISNQNEDAMMNGWRP